MNNLREFTVAYLDCSGKYIRDELPRRGEF